MSTSLTAPWSSKVLDTILSAQLLVTWAGEGGEEPRLSWWRTELVSEFGGEDLLRRLLQGSWRWAMVQAVREAARRCDAELRRQHHGAEQIHSLFHFGFDLDENLEERLQEHERAALAPPEALPQLTVTTTGWDRDIFDAWLCSHDAASSSQSPVGRSIKGPPPRSPRIGRRSWSRRSPPRQHARALRFRCLPSGAGVTDALVLDKPRDALRDRYPTLYTQTADDMEIRLANKVKVARPEDLVAPPRIRHRRSWRTEQTSRLRGFLKGASPQAQEQSR